MSAIRGVPVVVVNKTGGGGATGADYAAKAKPDGYVVYASTNSVLTISPWIIKNLPYRTTDFVPIGAYASDFGAITVKAGGPAKTLEEFIDYAKKNPGKLIPLVTTSPKRLAAFPNVPTMAEKGFPEASLNIWLGLYVPKATSGPVVDVLVKAVGIGK
jgi:tripartite-type tricarboxylate transporter receptor subunit TctC